jgi:hypothetical protein
MHGRSCSSLLAVWLLTLCSSPHCGVKRLLFLRDQRRRAGSGPDAACAAVVRSLGWLDAPSPQAARTFRRAGLGIGRCTYVPATRPNCWDDLCRNGHKDRSRPCRRRFSCADSRDHPPGRTSSSRKPSGRECDHSGVARPVVERAALRDWGARPLPVSPEQTWPRDS